MSYYRDGGYDDRPVTIKRYVIPSEDRDDRREFSMSRDDPYGERELVIRRKTDVDDPLSIRRYERDVEYDPPARRYEYSERDYYEREYPAPPFTHRHADLLCVSG